MLEYKFINQSKEITSVFSESGCLDANWKLLIRVGIRNFINYELLCIIKP